MFEKLEIFQMAGAMARHAVTRQTEIARNTANADTPGYKARDVAPFSETYRQQTGGMQQRATRPGHFARSDKFYPVVQNTGGGSESPNGNNVSLESEMMKSVEASSEHDRALAIYKSSLNILRLSLGRR